MNHQPFTVNAPDATLRDLSSRIRRTRWPNEPSADGWAKGTPLAFMRELADYWVDGYDWRAVERRLNGFDQYLARVDGGDVHFVHHASGRADAVPIVLLHGWADAFTSYLGVAMRLAEPAPDPSFHVVVPSMPGFGFSSPPPLGQMTPTQAASAVAAVMDQLGYSRYAVYGGDWGSVVAQELARNQPDRIIGLQLADVPFGNYFMVDREQASPDERGFLDALERWGATESGYVSIQSTRPLTLAYGLSDSPIGLAAWILEHHHRYADAMPSNDDLITTVMTYWLSNSIHSSTRLYGEWEGEGEVDWDTADAGGGWGGRIEVPTAIAQFPRDLASPPRELAERFFDVRRFTSMERGGHFAALEVPDLLATEIRAFVADLLPHVARTSVAGT